MTDQQDANAILEEFGIRVVGANVAPGVGETRAVATLHRIAKRYGFDHARLVVQVLAESVNNMHPLTETVLWATSDVLRAFAKCYPDVAINHMTDVFKFFDGVPLGALEFKFCRSLDGITSKRAALVGQIWERAVRVFGDPQLDLLDDRRTA